MRSRTSLQNYLFVVELCHSNTWGISSVGRAFEWHSKGQRFNSAMLHHLKSRYHISGFFNINACSPKKIFKKKVELVLSGVTVKCFDINNLLLSCNTEYRAISSFVSEHRRIPIVGLSPSLHFKSSYIRTYISICPTSRWVAIPVFRSIKT